LAALYLTCALQPPETQIPSGESSTNTADTSVNASNAGHAHLRQAIATSSPGTALGVAPTGNTTSATCTIQLSERVKEWMAGLSAPLEEVAEVAQHLLALYRVWNDFRDLEDVAAILSRLRDPTDTTATTDHTQMTPAT
jgi:hypothetical protein